MGKIAVTEQFIGRYMLLRCGQQLLLAVLAVGFQQQSIGKMPFFILRVNQLVLEHIEIAGLYMQPVQLIHHCHIDLIAARIKDKHIAGQGICQPCHEIAVVQLILHYLLIALRDHLVHTHENHIQLDLSCPCIQRTRQR